MAIGVQGKSHHEISQQVQAGDIDLPEDIIKYLQISQKPFNHTGNIHINHSNWLNYFWRHKIKRDHPETLKSPLDIEHKKIIHYLENYLIIDKEKSEK